MHKPHPGHEPSPDIPGPEVSGAFGIWLNKRKLIMLEMPFRHTITPEHNGWRMDVLEQGKLVARQADDSRRFDVAEGDYLLSSGDDLYLALRRVKAHDRGKSEDDEATEDGAPERVRGES
jgi:hypothetical protein